MASELSNFQTLAEEDHLTALVPTWDAGEATSVLADPGTFIIGSSRQSDIRVALPGIGAQHCAVECLDGSVFVAAVADNPVLLNDSPVATRTETHAGDRLTVGPATFRIEQRKASRVRRPIMPRQPIPPVSAAKSVTVPQANAATELIDAIEVQVAEAMSADVDTSAKPSVTTRESQLLDLQRRLEERNQELDAWSEQLMQQQSELLNRQTELQQRKAETERRHREEFAQLSAHKNSLLENSGNENEERQRELDRLASELEVHQGQLLEKKRQLREASERLANRDLEVEQLIGELQSRAAQDGEVRATWQTEKQELDTLSRQLAAQEAELKAAREAFESAKDEDFCQTTEAHADLERRETELSWHLKSIDEVRSTATQDAERIAAEKKNLDAAREQLEQERECQVAELEAVRAELDALQSDLNAREEQLSSAAHTAEQLAEKSQAIERARTDLEAEKLALQQQNATETSAINRSRAALWELEQRLKQESSEVSAIREEVERERSECGARSLELQNWETELDSRHSETADRIVQFKQLSAASASATNTSTAEVEALTQQLSTAQSEAKQLAEERGELLTALNELRTAFEAAKEELLNRDQNVGSAVDTADLDAARQTIGERDQTLAELQASLAEKTAEVSRFQDEIKAAEETLAAERGRLEAELQIAKTSTSSAEPTETETALKNELEQLRADLKSTQAANAGTTSDEVRLLHRELDDRTVVLDKREEEVRERQRMLENSEGELEEQRRAMLESRQQLELARAEIQVAMDAVRQSEQTSPAFTAEPAPSSFDVQQEQHDAVTESHDDTTPQVRSEIAELFGLGETPTEADRDDLEAVDDYSQETAAAVSLSFNEASQVLLSAPEAVAEAEPEASQPENSPEDVVADYMEQLLSRNREHAGGVLPKELKKEDKPQPATGTQESSGKDNKPPAQKSFIDAYMSGQYGDAEGVTQQQPRQSENTATPAAPTAPATPRAKIDLNALRSEMNSFRQLSTKSVENALATHAKRQQRGGLVTRSSICLVLSMVCVFVVAAALMNVIPFGFIVWSSMAAALVSISELSLHSMKLKNQLREATQKVAAAPPSATAQPTDQASAAEFPTVPPTTATSATVSTSVEEPETLSADDILADEAAITATHEHSAPSPIDAANGQSASATATALGRSQIEEMLAEITGGGSDKEDAQDDPYYEL